jgi:hypothetical protein
MTPRDRALLYSPPLAGLLAALAWLVLDPKGDARHGLDRLIRTLTR